jgi:hypothetical protein
MLRHSDSVGSAPRTREFLLTRNLDDLLNSKNVVRPLKFGSFVTQLWPLAIAAVLGIFLIALKSVNWPWVVALPVGIVDFCYSVGTTLLAGVIAGGIISWVFSKQLARDVFNAAMGYFLPDYLASELRWIYEQTVIATNTQISYELSGVGEHAVRMVLEVIRTFQNTGPEREEVPLTFGIDEWSSPAGQSEIVEYGYKTLEETRVFRGSEVTTIREPHHLGLDDKRTLRLSQGAELTVWYKAVEFKHLNDDTFLVFAMPSRNPQVKVRYDEHKLCVSVGFAHRHREEPLGTGTYQLQGTLLRGQHIRIRWWPAASVHKLDSNNLESQ